MKKGNLKKVFAVVMAVVMILTIKVAAFASDGKLTLEQAKQAALDYSGVSASEAVFTKAHRGWDDGREVFEIEFYAGGIEYDMDVDVYTGQITDFNKEYHGAYSRPGTGYGYHDYDDLDDLFDWDDDRYDWDDDRYDWFD